ncbi:MAG: ABC transporter permease [bacterium]
MLINYILTAIRNIKKQRIVSCVNILGLSLAMASCIYILIYVIDEMKYDQYNENKKCIVRLIKENRETKEKEVLQSALAYDEYFEQIPEFIKGFRISQDINQIVNTDENKYIDNIFYADKEILTMFSFPLIRGDKNKALEAPFSVVIDENIAVKYFGTTNVIGKIIKVENEHIFRITGVLKNIPLNSHIRPQIIVSFSTLKISRPNAMKEYNSSCFFYFQIHKNASITNIEVKLNKKYAEKAGKDWAKIIKVKLEPLDKIYLYSADSAWDFAAHGDINTIKGLLAITFMILLMATFNYTNILTTLIKIREKELAIRKTLGAGKRDIVKQFLLESFTYLFIALILAFIIVLITIDLFNQFTGKLILLSDIFCLKIFVFVMGILIFSMIIAVIYPSIIAIKNNTIDRLKGGGISSSIKFGKISFGFRQIVICLQFIITVGLLISVGIIYKQLNFARNEKLGFNKENIISIDNPWDENMFGRYETYKSKISQYPAILSVAAGGNVPSENINNYTWIYSQGMQQKDNIKCAQIAMDYDYFKTLQTKILYGRNFSKDFPSDNEKAIVVTESVVKELKLQNPIGALIYGLNNAESPQTIIGVVEDIHFKSFKEQILPIVFYMRYWGSANILVRVNGKNITKTIQILEKAWKDVRPDRPLLHKYLDESYNKLYENESRIEKLIMIFCVIAIFISGIGLFSLILLTSQMRRKEIGIRKVVGAKVSTIVKTMIKEYIIIVITACLIAIPITYFIMEQWLQDYIYKIEITAWYFILASIAAIVLTLIAVGFQAFKAATENPINSLKYE